MGCPVCGHDVSLEHDGHGEEFDPFICRVTECECAWYEEDGDPVAVILEDRG